MKCVDCEHFTVRQNPIKAGDGIYYDSGLAECKKHKLVIDFVSTRQLNKLRCVEHGTEEKVDTNVPNV